jgi:uncharacterized Zn finger protein
MKKSPMEVDMTDGLISCKQCGAIEFCVVKEYATLWIRCRQCDKVRGVTKLL